MRSFSLWFAVVCSVQLAACGGGDFASVTPPSPLAPVTPVATVVISGAPSAAMALGATAVLSASVRDASNNTLNGRAISWASSLASVATVTNGVVTAVAAGATTISATSEGKSASVDITVALVPATITINRSASYILTGDTLQLSARVLTANGQEIPGVSVAVTLDQPSVATLTGSVLTGRGPGQVVVRASAGTLSTSATIIVFPGAGVRVPMLSQLDSVMISEMVRLGQPGGAMAVVKDGRLVLSRTYGYADSATKRIPSLNDKWRIGSVSKPLTALGILKLVQEGRLTLDEFAAPRLTAVPLLPGKTEDPRFARITIRHLLQHAAGWDANRSVDDSTFSYLYAARTVDARQLSRVGRGIPLATVPGTVYAYTNHAYLLLGRIIEQVTGQRYESWMMANILGPLGATGMKLGRTALTDRDPLEVTTYDRRPVVSGYYGVGTWPNVGAAQEYAEASGQWIGTSVDLVRVLAAVDGETTRPDLLSASTLATMWTRSAALFPGTGYFYSLGWENHPATGGFAREHVGGADGGDAWISLLPNAAGIAVQFNLTRGQGNGGGTAAEAMRGVLARVTTWPTGNLFP